MHDILIVTMTLGPLWPDESLGYRSTNASAYFGLKDDPFFKKYFSIPVVGVQKSTFFVSDPIVMQRCLSVRDDFFDFPIDFF